MDGTPTGLPPLERYREYLELISRVLLDPKLRRKLDPKLRRKLDPSDVVQEAMLRAMRAIHQFRGTTEEELRAWLRKILSNTLTDQYRAFTGATRDVNLENSLQEALKRSSERLETWLHDPCSGPEEKVLREEQLDQLARAINHLPSDQQTAVELHNIHAYTIAEISQQMGR
ncbi:MAG: sigma-70 family RNA polymerase sigma factor [Isosphaeraceae bacterium]